MRPTKTIAPAQIREACERIYKRVSDAWFAAPKSTPGVLVREARDMLAWGNMCNDLQVGCIDRSDPAFERFPEFMDLHGASRYIGRSPRTLQRWRACSVGPASERIGKHFVYHKAAIDDWLASPDGKIITERSKK